MGNEAGKARRDASRAALRAVLAAGLLALAAAPLCAWGPHVDITKAALAVLPEADRWKAELGEENLAALNQHCLMPDQRGNEMRDYYIDDYLLFRGLPTYIGHVAPEVKQAFAPCFRRAVQGLRTETPANACRQLGPLLHFVEDLGAPPHTGPGIANHGPMENWVNAAEIDIAGYKPQLLGRTDDEALAGLLNRLDALQAFSAERAAKAGPLVAKGEGERPKVEPILLESANESARAAADMLYTVFTVGLAKQPPGAALEGTVEAPALFRNNEKGARIVLIDNAKLAASGPQAPKAGGFVQAATDYTTLATTVAGAPAADGWRGEFKFHNLPAGVFRILAVRPGARWTLSEPVTLAVGKATTVKLSLPAEEAAGNIVMNPDGRLRYLPGGAPDRWRLAALPDKNVGTGRAWTSAWVKVPVSTPLSAGAVMKDPSAKVRFWAVRGGPKGVAQFECVGLVTGEERPAALRLTPEKAFTFLVTVETDRPLATAIGRVWLVPEAAPSGK